MNFLETLIAEWLEFTGFFVRRNVLVGKSKKGGHEGELDVIGFNPVTRQLVHYESSTDCHSWKKREMRFLQKFDTGRRHIFSKFKGFELPETVEQYAVFLWGSNCNHSEVGGGKILMVDDLLRKILDDLETTDIRSGIVPELYPRLRTLHLVSAYREKLLRPQNPSTVKVHRRKKLAQLPSSTNDETA